MRASRPNGGQGSPSTWGSTITGRLRAHRGHRRPVRSLGWEGSLQARISYAALCYWLLRRREESQASWCPRGPPDLGARSEPAVQPGLDVEASGPGASARAAAWSVGEAAPASPPPGLPSSLPPPACARLPPPPQPRAAHEMAPVCSPRLAPRRRAREPQRATPPDPGAPETASATSPRPRALCPPDARGPAGPRDRRLPRASNDNRGRREEGQGERPRAARRPARPARPRPQPAALL